MVIETYIQTDTATDIDIEYYQTWVQPSIITTRGFDGTAMEGK